MSDVDNPYERPRIGGNPARGTDRVEYADGTAAQAYVNVLAVKEGRENEPAIQALAAALCSDEVKAFIDETYAGAVVAVF